ncbi:sialate O-acetylesterase [Anatilimnocola floriformis]|uniref:sialate O-acetylesterase n=1 Tax=Anatilimnocola floriformis TaxID=2948575 RepID=UPI0020C363F9|nr:sialate O-acetylesterase [Anatilimnocola floriformis]
MLTRRFFAAFAALAVIAAANFASAETKLPAKDKFHLFLLVGQSNMAGRGKVEDEDKRPDPRVLALNKAGEWVPAVDPIHFDKGAAGVGLGKSFGLQIAEANPGITIGLIPCAVGGSPIDSWKPGEFYKPTNSHPWDDAIKRAKLAVEKGTLKGILWHQGESDSNAKLAPTYDAKLQDLVKRFRAELGSDVPFLVGQIGQFEDVPWDEYNRQVDQAHQNLSKHVVNAAYVSAAGLKHKGDKVHFDSASLREFGKRYAEAFTKLTK